MNGGDDDDTRADGRRQPQPVDERLAGDVEQRLRRHETLLDQADDRPDAPLDGLLRLRPATRQAIGSTPAVY